MPTEGQNTVLFHLAAFLLSEKANPTYLLQGYAGTGKTTLVTTLVKTLPQLGMRYQLMAPTGRAAKVLSGWEDSVNDTQKNIPFPAVFRRRLSHDKSRKQSKKHPLHRRRMLYDS